MNRYVVFIKSGASRVVKKEGVTREVTKELKLRGFRKHPVEVEAENENQAVDMLNENSNAYLGSLKDFSGDALLCSICVIVMAIVFFFG